MRVLVKALKDLCNADKSDKPLDFSNAKFPENQNVLKYEIIEVFIKNNDYATKDQWLSSMKEECERLSNEKLFPDSIMAAFKMAIIEVKNELTLTNIREIKKLISGSK